MRTVDYIDSNGYKRRSLVKDEDTDDMAEFGIPVGPPELDLIDWELFKHELNERLVSAGLFTYDDLQRNQKEFIGALHTLKRHLIKLYQDTVK